MLGLNVEYRSGMNPAEACLVLTLGSALVVTAATVDTTASKHNRYKVILDRNPFGLKAAPPPISKPPPKIVKPVKFTGITSDGSSKRAWFVIPPGPGRPQARSFSLSEGDTDDGLKVLEINEKDATVEILNGETPATLNFREHGLAAPIRPASKLYRGIRGAGFFVPQPKAQKPEQTRALVAQSRSPAVMSRPTNVLTDTLFKARSLPLVRKNTSSLLPKR